MRSNRVVHIGPSLRARGGIAGVMRGLLGSSLAERYELRTVSTVTHHSGAIRFSAFPVALAHLTLMFMCCRPAAIHVHTASWGSFPRKRIVVALASVFRVPVILHVHGGGFAEYLEQRASRIRGVRRTLQRSAAVIVLSEALRQRLAALEPAIDVRVVPNAVEIPSSPTRGIAETRIVFVGRPVAEKGVGELLEAARDIARKGQVFTLEIAGHDSGGQIAAQIRDLGLEGSAHMRGWLDHAELHLLLDSSSIFVLPSHVEAMPVSLLEAMSYGLACVVTPVGAVPDIITDGTNGIIVPVGDVAALEAALERLLDDESLRRRLGKHARKTVSVHYSLDQTADLVGEIYEACGVKRRESNHRE